MNERFEKLIKDLPEELQDKAKDIDTVAELNDFMTDNEIELSEDILNAIAGGGTAGCHTDYYHKGECSGIVDRLSTRGALVFECSKCNQKVEFDDVGIRPDDWQG